MNIGEIIILAIAVAVVFYVLRKIVRGNANGAGSPDAPKAPGGSGPKGQKPK